MGRVVVTVTAGHRWPMRCADVFGDVHEDGRWPWSWDEWAVMVGFEKDAERRRLPLVEVAVSYLVATQRIVYRKGVERHERYGTREADPLAVRWGGRLWLADGHHRATLAVLRGGRSIWAHLCDLETATEMRAA